MQLKCEVFQPTPVFYKNILDSFNELKTLRGNDQSQGIVLFNNKDILVGGKPVYNNEWFKKGLVSIEDFLNNDENFLTFKEFSDSNTHAKLAFFSIIK